MSDAPQGDGWWEASDHRWYPPEQHPDYEKPASGFSRARVVEGRSVERAGPGRARPEPETPSRSRSAFAWLSWQSAVVLAAGLLSVLLLGLAIGAGDGDGDDTEVLGVTATTPPTSASTSTSSTSTTAPATTSTDVTRSTALPLGQTSTVGEWDVTIVGFVPNATDAVIAADARNGRPTDWHVYSLVTLRATYNGSDEATASLDLTVGFVGEDQRDHQDRDCEAVPPEQRISDQPRVSTGGTVVGNVCLEVPIPQLETGALYVEQSLASDDTRQWWATG